MDQVFGQFEEAFAALWLSGAWSHIAAFDFHTGLGVHAPGIASRWVELDHFEVAEW